MLCVVCLEHVFVRTFPPSKLNLNEDYNFDRHILVIIDVKMYKVTYLSVKCLQQRLFIFYNDPRVDNGPSRLCTCTNNFTVGVFIIDCTEVTHTHVYAHIYPRQRGSQLN